MTGTITYREHDWSYRTNPCTDDSGSIYVEVQHPGSMRWELAGYALEGTPQGDIEEEEVKRFADNELD